MREKSEPDRRSSESTGEKIIKWLVAISGIITLLVGIIQFNATRNKEIKLAYYDYQLKLFDELATITGEIAVASKNSYVNQKSYFDSIENRFLKLFYGNLNLIKGDHSLKTYLDEFETALDNYKAGITDRSKFRDMQRKISLCCQRILNVGYGIAFDEKEINFDLKTNTLADSSVNLSGSNLPELYLDSLDIYQQQDSVFFNKD